MGDLQSPHYVKRTAQLFNNNFCTQQSKSNGESVSPPVKKFTQPPLTSPSLVNFTTSTRSTEFILNRIQKLYSSSSNNSQNYESNSNDNARIIPIQIIKDSPKETKTQFIESEKRDKLTELQRMKSLEIGKSVGLQSLLHSHEETNLNLSKVDKNENNLSDEKDGNYFLGLMKREKGQIEKLIEEGSEILKNLENLGKEEECGVFRAAIGKASLLINKKFKQFEGLCHTNLEQRSKGVSGDERATKDEDLEGFWDMVSIQVKEIHQMFKQLDPKNENSDEVDSNKPTVKVPVKKASVKKTVSKGSKINLQSAAPLKNDEMRRKLLAEKRREMKNLATSDPSSESSPIIFL